MTSVLGDFYELCIQALFPTRIWPLVVCVDPKHDSIPDNIQPCAQTVQIIVVDSFCRSEELLGLKSKVVSEPRVPRSWKPQSHKLTPAQCTFLEMFVDFVAPIVPQCSSMANVFMEAFHLATMLILVLIWSCKLFVLLTLAQNQLVAVHNKLNFFFVAMASLWDNVPLEGILNVKTPPPEIRLQVENFILESYDPFLFPEAKVATEKLRQELKLVEFRLAPKITMSEYNLPFSPIYASGPPLLYFRPHRMGILRKSSLWFKTVYLFFLW